MNKIFLRAKHWKIFLLTIGVATVFQILIAIIFTILFMTQTSYSSQIKIINDISFPILGIYLFLIFFCWAWSIGVGLNRLLPDDLKLKTFYFKLFSVIAFLFIAFFYASILFPTLLTKIDSVVMLIKNIITMFCMFYCIYFIAMTYKTAYLKRRVSLGDFIGEFFLIIIFPVGIWIIQPRINKLIKAHTANTTLS